MSLMCRRLFSDVFLQRSEKLQIKVRGPLSLFHELSWRKSWAGRKKSKCLSSTWIHPGSQQAEGGAEVGQGQSGEEAAGGAESGASFWLIPRPPCVSRSKSSSLFNKHK